jgi:thiamine transporter ThiT
METKKRTIVRTISYRIIALLVTAIWTGLNNAIIIHIILTLIHYILERIWLTIKWGKI